MTDDLISRNTLKQRIIKDYRKEFFGSVLWNILDDMPPISAVPVVHARWVPNHGSYGTPHCSNCKWRIPYSEDSTLDARSFCPNCGAKMDGGADNG